MRVTAQQLLTTVPHKKNQLMMVVVEHAQNKLIPTRPAQPDRTNPDLLHTRKMNQAVGGIRYSTKKKSKKRAKLSIRLIGLLTSKIIKTAHQQVQLETLFRFFGYPKWISSLLTVTLKIGKIL